MNDVQPVNARPEFAERQATTVRVFTPAGIVEGLYHHPPGVRLSDSLRNSATSERYMMLTDVTVRPLDGGSSDAVPERAPFILISSSHANMIVPVEDAAG